MRVRMMTGRRKKGGGEVGNEEIVCTVAVAVVSKKDLEGAAWNWYGAMDNGRVEVGGLVKSREVRPSPLGFPFTLWLWLWKERAHYLPTAHPYRMEYLLWSGQVR
jgi:hypothetical protein